MRTSRHTTVELPTSSMADIAFLLLTFFLITTVIENHKGLTLQLPPWQKDVPVTEIHDRNLFAIQLNAADQCMVEGEPVADLSGLDSRIRTFVLNDGHDPSLSESPEVAVVSFKTDRGTSYGRFIEVLDVIQGAYYGIYAGRVGISTTEFRALDLRDPKQKATYDRARKGIPMNISIADPSEVRP